MYRLDILKNVGKEVVLKPFTEILFTTQAQTCYCGCVIFSAGSIPGFVRYRSIPEFCSILDTYVVIKSNFHIEHSSQ